MRLRRKAKEPKVPLATKNENMTLTQHLAELRMRLIRCLLAVVLFGVVVFVLYDPWIQDFLFHPYREVCAANPSFNCNGNPVLITPLGGFTTRMKVAGWGGIILAMPVMLWQVWRFIVPGLESKEKRYALPFILSTIALFLFGAFVAYLTLEPALQFLISYAGQATAAFTPESYVSLVGLMMAAFGAGFLFPVLLVFLQLAGVLSYKQLLRLVAVRDRGHRGHRRRDHAERRPHQHAGPRHPDVPLVLDLRRHRLARQPAPGQGHRRSRPSGRPEPRRRALATGRGPSEGPSDPAHWCRAP